MNKASEKKSTKTSFKKGGMFEGAIYLVFELAKDLRKNMTHAEKILWMHLKAGVHGMKLRRQHPIGIYIADFYCHKIKLIIEVDGNIHDKKENKEYDINREKDLQRLGYTILRFRNTQIFNNIEAVLAEINSKAKIELQKLSKVKNVKAPFRGFGGLI